MWRCNSLQYVKQIDVSCETNLKECIKMLKLTKKMLNENLYVSDGNKKLIETVTEYFLIWSLPAVSTCHWRTKQCEFYCYAKKAEAMYPDCLPCRERNLEESKKENFVPDMIKVIQWNLQRPSKKGKQCYFRIHESGDFYSLEYLKSWIQIAKYFPNVIFTAYTKAINLIELVINDIPSNFVIRYSVWSDTDPEQIAKAEKLNLPIYTAYTEDVLEKKVQQENFTKCDCKCENCKKCYSLEFKKIAVAIH